MALMSPATVEADEVAIDHHPGEGVVCHLDSLAARRPQRSARSHQRRSRIASPAMSSTSRSPGSKPRAT